MLYKIFYDLSYFVNCRKGASIDNFIYGFKKFFPVKVLEDLQQIKIKVSLKKRNFH